jgi:hypothetical protein
VLVIETIGKAVSVAVTVPFAAIFITVLGLVVVEFPSVTPAAENDLKAQP